MTEPLRPRTRTTAVLLALAVGTAALLLVSVGARALLEVEDRRTQELPRVDAHDAAVRAQDLVVWSDGEQLLDATVRDGLATLLVSAWETVALPEDQRTAIAPSLFTGPALRAVQSGSGRDVDGAHHRVEVVAADGEGAIIVVSVRTELSGPGAVAEQEQHELVVVLDDARWLIRSMHRVAAGTEPRR